MIEHSKIPWPLTLLMCMFYQSILSHPGFVGFKNKGGLIIFDRDCLDSNEEPWDKNGKMCELDLDSNENYVIFPDQDAFNKAATIHEFAEQHIFLPEDDIENAETVEDSEENQWTAENIESDTAEEHDLLYYYYSPV